MKIFNKKKIISRPCDIIEFNLHRLYIRMYILCVSIKHLMLAIKFYCIFNCRVSVLYTAGWCCVYIYTFRTVLLLNGIRAKKIFFLYKNVYSYFVIQCLCVTLMFILCTYVCVVVFNDCLLNPHGSVFSLLAGTRWLYGFKWFLCIRK